MTDTVLIEPTPEEIYTNCITEFFEEYGLVYKPITVKERRRKYRNIGKILTSLYEEGKISTTDLALLTMKDMMHYAVYLRDEMTHAKVAYRCRFISLLNVACKYFANLNVEHAKKRWPSLFPKEHKSRPKSLTTAKYNAVIQYITRPNQTWYELRASFAVALPLCGGIRPQEDQFMQDMNLNLEEMICNLTHVKGQGVYADSRMSPVHPDAKDIVERYIAEYENRGMSGYLLMNPSTKNALAGNTLRQMFRDVSKACGVRITATICRATWIVKNLNECKNIEAVSVSAGHASSRTTAENYGRMSDEVALETVREGWILEDGRSKNCIPASENYLEKVGGPAGIRTRV